MAHGGGARGSWPLRERLAGAFSCFPTSSSRRSEKQNKAGKRGMSNETTSSRTATTGSVGTKAVDAVNHRPEQQQNNPIINSSAGAKIANYESQPPQIGRVGSVASSRNNSTAMKLMNSTSQSAPVSGELPKMGSPSLTKSTSRSLTKLRDRYVTAMLKLGDMSNSVNLGNSVTLDSRVFESDVIRRRSEADNEIMELYLHSSIQPGEWKDAQMGSRIIRNGSVAVR